MSNKLPQPTSILLKLLRRVAKALEREGQQFILVAGRESERAKWRAYANTCWQVAGRLEELTRRGSREPLENEPGYGHGV